MHIFIVKGDIKMTDSVKVFGQILGVVFLLISFIPIIVFYWGGHNIIAGFTALFILGLAIYVKT